MAKFVSRPSLGSIPGHRKWQLAIYVFIFGNIFLVSGEEACVCGVDRVPCATVNSSDCPNGRVIPRRDCGCCFLCAKQLTDSCNNEDALCDVDYGLECGVDGKCKAKTSCSDDTLCSNELMCVAGACADPCKVIPDVCKESNITSGICMARNHRGLCTCPPGTELSPDKECKPITTSVEEGKLIVTEQMFANATKEEETKPTANSMEEEETTTTSVPITDETTTTTTISTASPPQPHPQPASSVGCLYNGSSYEMGEIFIVGCDERCECLSGGEVKCLERCSIPLFKKGSFAHDKLCYEEPSGSDDCCVLVACSRDGRAEDSGHEIVLASTPQPCDSVKCGPNAHCLGPATSLGPLSEEEDQQTNQTLCVCNNGTVGDPYDEERGCETTPSSTLATPSAATDSSSSSSLLPSSSLSPATKEGCISKNKTYEFGEEQLEDCNYKCKCESSGEFLCLPRCNYRRDEEKEIPAGCKIEKDPADAECCEMLVCSKESKDKEKIPPPLPPTDGCVYKNKSYESEQKFYDGCESQCVCHSNGDVTCQSRCPPAAVANSSSVDCVTLPDPADKCCSVTICGNSTSEVLNDVMKAGENATIEGRSSSKSSIPSIRISLIHPFNESTVMVALRVENAAELESLSKENLTLYYTHEKNNEKSWKHVSSVVKDAIKTGRAEVTLPVTNLIPGTEYYFKAKVGQGPESNLAPGYTKFETLGSMEDGEFSSLEMLTGKGESSEEVDSTAATEEEDEDLIPTSQKLSCTHKSKTYDFGAQFFDGCDSYCSCRSNASLKCVPLECPTDGLDLLDDTCVKWEPEPGFVKTPPNCCPKLVCVQHSSCTTEGGLVIRNFDELPQTLSGCDKRCYCEFGNFSCTSLCPPVTESPPEGLPCPKEFAVVGTMKENECCMQWSCRMPQIPQHSLGNLTSNSSKTLESSTTPPTLTNNTQLAPKLPPGFIPQPHPNPHPIDKLNPHQLQELLHHLTSLGEPEHSNNAAGGHFNPPSSNVDAEGTLVQVQTPNQVRELEKELGAKFVEQAEDGSYILLIPNGDEDEETNFSVPPRGQHHSRPFDPHAISHGQPQAGHQFPFGLNPFQQFQKPHHVMHQDRTKVSNIVIQPLNESTLQIDFTVSSILVGLQGHVEVLYTSEFEHKPNPAQWDRKVFQQAEDLIDNTHLQLFLAGLAPDTEYHLIIKVVVLQSDIGSGSEILKVRTPPLSIPTSTLPPEIDVDPELVLRSSNSTSVHLHWRKLKEFEKSFVDGVQLAYKASDDKVYSTTPLLHRSLSEYELESLHPDKEYEINLLFVPFSSEQRTILKSSTPIFVHTPPAQDQYAFDLAIAPGKISSNSLELDIEGVPHPEDKFVNIYQVIYQVMGEGEEQLQKSYFKVPKRETSKKATLIDLKPGTNYTLWLEAFLSNGRKKRSNVISIQTKAGQLPRPEMTGQETQPHDLRSSSIPEAPSYYGALVALAIVASLAILGVIALLMILIKKQNYAKAPINSDRKSESSYDNPSFKSYDVESNGHLKPSEL